VDVIEVAIEDEILNGTQPRQLMLKHIRELDIPLNGRHKDAYLRDFGP